MIQINTQILPITLLISLPVLLILFNVAMKHASNAGRFLYAILAAGAIALGYLAFKTNNLIALQAIFGALIVAAIPSAFKKPSVRVTISQTAVNQAHDLQVPQRILIKLASYIEWQITKSGYPQPSYYMKNSNIVVTIGDEDPNTHEISMLTCKRDQRYSKGGQLLLVNETEQAQTPIKGKPLDERRQKAAARDAKRLRQRQQSEEARQRKAGNARPENEIPKKGRR